MSPPYLPVITTIVGPDGATLTPAEELRFIDVGDFVITSVTGDGPDRVEVRIYHDPSETFPGLVPVHQPSMTAAAPSARIIAFASLDGPTRFLAASYFPDAAVTHDGTNYTSVALYDADEDGNFTAIPLATSDTSATDWASGGVAAFELAIGIDIAKGHKVVALWEKHGGGVANPGGVWRVK